MRRSFPLLLLGLLTTACVPWTVVPIGEDAATDIPSSDPTAYVESIWDSRLLPAAGAAADVTAQPPPDGGPVLVRGRGVVLAHDASSRSGKLLVDFEPADGEADAAILTGPVILGTALRDAAGFIEFTNFANQLAYADVANELNRRVLEDVVARLDLTTATGKTLRFEGAWLRSGDALAEIVPVSLEVE